MMKQFPLISRKLNAIFVSGSISWHILQTDDEEWWIVRSLEMKKEKNPTSSKLNAVRQNFTIDSCLD